LKLKQKATDVKFLVLLFITFEVIIIVCLNDIFSTIIYLSLNLQSSNLDIKQFRSLVYAIKQRILELRNYEKLFDLDEQSLVIY
jgi:hypothetical protein